MQLSDWLDDGDTLVALDAAHDAAWDATDPALLALCRDRAAMLLGHMPTIDAIPPDVLHSLSAWTSSDVFAERERAALDFTEQYIIDVASMSNAQAAKLGGHLGDEGLVTFVNALLVIEQRMSLELALEGVFR